MLYILYCMCSDNWRCRCVRGYQAVFIVDTPSRVGSRGEDSDEEGTMWMAFGKFLMQGRLDHRLHRLQICNINEKHLCWDVQVRRVHGSTGQRIDSSTGQRIKD